MAYSGHYTEPAASAGGDANTSLSVNYLPTKFSRPHSPGLHPRRGGKQSPNAAQNPIRGGGLAAFRSGQARMPGAQDEDYDGVATSAWGGGKGHRPRWNKFKWILLVVNILLTVYSMLALIFCLLTWLNVWEHAEIIIVSNNTELVLSTTAAAVGVFTACLGWAGILLNNRAFLAVYTLFLWITFGFLVSPGYVAYRKREFNLEGKINAQWSREYGATGRLKIQNVLDCCGYYSPFVEATVSQTCYARSLLTGCKSPLLNFEKMALKRWYEAAFGLVPLQIGAIFAGLLCSNHVTYRFGKGMMPKAYRLDMSSMNVIMDTYAQQLAEQYGDEVASDVLSRSRNKMNSGLGSMPGSPATQSMNHLPATGGTTIFDRLARRRRRSYSM
ncbi:hypothetical protein DL93DRAFT_2123598 [Clavulina sp. PMI_390]|nr:hypothetical protein DL93DRAFT_2123598 [Clavulina sp. PMI_390]